MIQQLTDLIRQQVNEALDARAPPIPRNPVPINADPAPDTVEEVSPSDSRDSSSASTSGSEQSSDISR